MGYMARLVLTPDRDERKIVDILLLLDRLTFPLDYPIKVLGKWWWLIRDENDRACGFAGLEKIDEDTAFLCRVGVTRKHRGNGLQKKMIKLRETIAKREGFKHIITYTVAENYSSANNLIRSGYTLFKPANAGKCLYFYKCLDETLEKKEIREWQKKCEM